jgi:hypothetical protein
MECTAALPVHWASLPLLVLPSPDAPSSLSENKLFQPSHRDGPQHHRVVWVMARSIKSLVPLSTVRASAALFSELARKELQSIDATAIDCKNQILTSSSQSNSIRSHYRLFSMPSRPRTMAASSSWKSRYAYLHKYQQRSMTLMISSNIWVKMSSDVLPWMVRIFFKKVPDQILISTRRYRGSRSRPQGYRHWRSHQDPRWSRLSWSHHERHW